MSIKIILCDDDQEIINHYAQLIRKIAEKHKIEYELLFFSSGEKLLFYLSEKPTDADIIYLDIIMGQQNGVEIAKNLRSIGCNAQIIFLTSIEDYVYDAFDVQATQYLLKKGLTSDKFEQVFKNAIERYLENEKRFFIYEFDGKKNVVPISQISYADIWKRVVTLHYDGKSAKFYGSIDKLEKSLEPHNFVRIHRSFIINLTYVEQFDSHLVALKTGEKLPLGPTYRDKLSQTFSEYLTHFHVCVWDRGE